MRASFEAETPPSPDAGRRPLPEGEVGSAGTAFALVHTFVSNTDLSDKVENALNETRMLILGA
ncbi:MAG TPA: hypothetical protein VFG86_21415 [Chloroflexota bacterium]|nr:hypothetical protein [Chloroflexota bacterium]